MRQKRKEVKVVLLGDQSVGKTSIILRYVHNEFKLKQTQTNGVHFEEKSLTIDDETQLDFKIWDTAGQERFRAINSLYYKDAQVAIIVYDITNRKSFETLKFWVSELQQKGPDDAIIVLVGNKLDLIEQEVVTYQESIIYAKSIGAFLKQSSAKENKGIEELFEEIGQHVAIGIANKAAAILRNNLFKENEKENQKQNNGDENSDGKNKQNQINQNINNNQTKQKEKEVQKQNENFKKSEKKKSEFQNNDFKKSYRLGNPDDEKESTMKQKGCCQ